MPKGIPFVESDKGASILVSGGKYKGYEGWIHKTCVQPTKLIHVILAAKNGNEEKSCCLKRDFVNEVSFQARPRTMTEALLKEHKDIAVDMKCLVEKLATIHGYKPNTELFHIMWKMWEEEKQKEEAKSELIVRFVPTWTQDTLTPPAPFANSAPGNTAPTTPATTTNGVHIIPDGWDNDTLDTTA